MKKILRVLLTHEYVLWILVLAFVLRIPSFFEPYWYGDEAIYLTLGNGIRSGLSLYRDIHDNKPPLIYFFAALTGSVFWFRFFLTLWNSAAIVAFYALCRNFFEEKPVGTITVFGIHFPKPQWSILATAMFAIIPLLYEGLIANAEIFILLPVTLAMLFLVIQKKEQYSLPLCMLSGFLFSIAFLIKIPPAFEAASAGLFFFLLSYKKSVTHTLSAIGAFSLAFCLPILASFLYYAHLGVALAYIQAAFAQNIGYLSSWSNGTHQAANITQSGLKYRFLALAGISLFFLVMNKKIEKKRTFLLLWLSYAFFGALLSERPYPHYVIQVITPSILLLIYILLHMKDLRRKYFESAVTIVCSVIWIFFSVRIHFWQYPMLPYYQNFFLFAIGKIDKETYFSYFDTRLPELYKLSTYIEKATDPSERIFVWGDLPSIYALTRRLPPGRFTSGYHINDFNGFAETIADSIKRPPAYIVIDSLYQKPYAELADFLLSHYHLTYTYKTLYLYKKN